MRSGTAFAPAKINLGLRISGRYENGYHHLETVFIPVALFDRLEIRPAAYDRATHRWPVETPADLHRKLAAGTIKNPLLQRTLAFLRNYLAKNENVDLPPLHIDVAKRIPSPSGLGGASSDAAAVLGSVCQSLQIKPAVDFLAATTALGADIPFFLGYGLYGRSARLAGIGHELIGLSVPRLGGWIFVPRFGFVTAEMFAHVRTWSLPLLAAKQPQIANSNLALRLNEIPYSDEPESGVRFVRNDFDTAATAVFPKESRVLLQAKIAVAKAVKQFFPGEWIVGMTGSGAGLFTATEMDIPVRALDSLKRLLKARLGEGWRIYSFRSLAENIGP